jgi:hypothetical protein
LKKHIFTNTDFSRYDPKDCRNTEWDSDQFPYIKKLTPDYEKAIMQLPLLNIDSLLIPSPHILDKAIDIAYEHSLVWDEKGELLGYLLVYAWCSPSEPKNR